MQRISGVVLIPASLWMLFSIIPYVGKILLGDADVQNQAFEFIFGPIYNVSTLIIFLVCGLYHGTLGMKSIIYDYIQCPVQKKIAITFVSAISFVTMVFGLVFIMDAHVGMINGQTNDNDITVISEEMTQTNGESDKMEKEPDDMESKLQGVIHNCPSKVLVS